MRDGSGGLDLGGGKSYCFVMKMNKQKRIKN